MGKREFYNAFILIDRLDKELVKEISSNDIFWITSDDNIINMVINSVIPSIHESVTKSKFFGIERPTKVIRFDSVRIYVEKKGDRYFDVISQIEIKNGIQREFGEIDDIAFDGLSEIRESDVVRQLEDIKNCMNPNQAYCTYCSKLKKMRDLAISRYHKHSLKTDIITDFQRKYGPKCKQ